MRASPKLVHRRRELRASPISVVISPMDHCSIKIDATFIVGEFTFFVNLAIKTEHLLVGRGVTAYYITCPQVTLQNKLSGFYVSTLSTLHIQLDIKHSFSVANDGSWVSMGIFPLTSQ